MSKQGHVRARGEGLRTGANGRGTRTVAAITAACAVAASLLAVAAPAGAVSSPFECPPLSGDGLFSAAGFPGSARVLPPAAHGGVVEPNVEEAYQRELSRPPSPGFGGLEMALHASGRIKVPVYVHVLRTSSGDGDVTDQQIADQMDVLNSSFDGATGGVNTRFVFELAGVDRTANSNWYAMAQGETSEQQAKAALRQGGSRALNIYIGGLTGGLLGWGTFPDRYAGSPTLDGVVVLNSSLPGGSTVPYNEGDTAVHEVGHWLGLFHTFEGLDGGCIPPGDLVDDTPYEAGPALGCPVGSDTCPAEGLDPITNFMDYSDDACMFEFTHGQADRMQSQVAQYRNSAPSATDGSLTATSGVPTSLTLGVSDAEEDPYVVEVTDPPDHGRLSGSGAKRVYTAERSYTGPDSVTFKATDLFGATETATVEINVTGS